MDPDFGGTPQGQVLVRLGQAQEAGDHERFAKVLADFKSSQGKAFYTWQEQLGDRALGAMTHQEEDFS